MRKAETHQRGSGQGSGGTVPGIGGLWYWAGGLNAAERWGRLLLLVPYKLTAISGLLSFPQGLQH